mgnify:CR=1 FL=1
MAKYEAGFIGAGNMGGALATAAAKQVTGERVAVACSSPAHSAAAAERLGVSQTTFLKWAKAENLPKK